MITILIPDRKRELMTALGFVVAMLAACNTSVERDTSLHVVATTSIWGHVVEQLVGDDGIVDVLIPVGADAHDYSPSPAQVASLLEADLVVANGLGLEQGLGEILDAAVEDGANLVELAARLDPLPFEEGGLDPHVWQDPLRVAEAAELIAFALQSVAPDIDWSSRADVFAGTMTETDVEIMRLLGPVPPEDRLLVTNHEALGYFAERYGFRLLGVVIPGGSTLGDPSSAELAELVSTIEAEGVGAIFAETTNPSALAEAVAAEVGHEVEVVLIHTESLGEEGSVAETLSGMLVTNARLMAQGLAG